MQRNADNTNTKPFPIGVYLRSSAGSKNHQQFAKPWVLLIAEAIEIFDN